MEKAFEACEIYRWPSGDCRPIALVAMGLTELSARLGIAFVDDHDDLDDLKRAAIRLASGEQFLFVRHARAPKPGVQVYTDSETPQTEALMRLLAAADIPDISISWAPHAEYRIVAIPGQVQVRCGDRIIYAKGMPRHDFVAERYAARGIGLAFILVNQHRILISESADGADTVVRTKPVPRRQ